MLQIIQRFDSEDAGATIEVRSPRARIMVYIRNRRAPVMLDATDKALMQMCARSMVQMGVRPRRLLRRDAQYALWAIAQHLKATAGSMGEELYFAGLPLLPGLSRGSEAVVRVEARS
jgi:hypothetical protein